LRRAFFVLSSSIYLGFFFFIITLLSLFNPSYVALLRAWPPQNDSVLFPPEQVSPSLSFSNYEPQRNSL
jgi:hypothetical protein